MKSKKEHYLDNKILKVVSGLTKKTAEIILHDKIIQYLQNYANTVSIKRLGFNDHGPVHMKKVALNALAMTDLLNEAGIKLSLEDEGVGTFEDSKVAILIAAFIHDIGMTVGRQDHEKMSVLLAMPILEKILPEIYPDNLEKQLIVRSVIIECIEGHMGNKKVHSLEAGLILIADGCDMEKGRARIPMLMTTESRVGDIHKYSAAEIKKVKIEKGDSKPIKITVEMNESVGFFQVEEVLFGKIDFSTVKKYIELYAGVIDRPLKKYL